MWGRGMGMCSRRHEVFEGGNSGEKTEEDMIYSDDAEGYTLQKGLFHATSWFIEMPSFLSGIFTSSGLVFGAIYTKINGC